MELIETIEVGAGGAASIEFTSIPQDGVDLLIVVSARTDQAINWTDGHFSINGGLPNTGKMLYGSNGTVASISSGASVLRINGTSSTASTFNSTEIRVSNYTSSNYKSLAIDNVVENNSTTNFMAIRSVSSPFTAAVTSLTFTGSGGFVQYSTASLYKITKA